MARFSGIAHSPTPLHVVSEIKLVTLFRTLQKAHQARTSVRRRLAFMLALVAARKPRSSIFFALWRLRMPIAFSDVAGGVLRHSGATMAPFWRH